MRIRLLSLAIILVGLILVLRLYFIQVVHGDDFASDASRQHINKNTVLYDRGSIYFNPKSGEESWAAISRSGFTVAINPSIIKDPVPLFNALSSILPINKEEFLAKASKENGEYREIVTHINKETADKVKALNLYGITVAVDKKRFYPAGRTASHTIGFVGYDGDKLIGKYGLERSYEDTLKKDPNSAYSNFFAEFFINVKETFSDSQGQSGDIYTSLEPSVQLFVEAELENVMKTWNSDGAGAVVMDPMNGEIISLAWMPSFDPNDLSEETIEKFKNPIVEGVYEMGSIIKPISMASGLDSGTVTATSTYYDNGFLVLNSKRISNYDGRGRGLATMQNVLNQSLNTGVAYVAMKMGNKKFSEYMYSFGLGTETGIDLPNETKGLVKNLDSKRDIEMATASYGQGIALTPIATVRALSVLANGGVLVVPHIVKKIVYDNGLSKKISFAPGKQVISKATSDEITRMLVNVVDTSLRDGKAKIPGYSVAAKTGTAQMTDEGVAGYADGKYLHSFFGYFPAYKPRFLVFLFHTHPKGVRYASETLTDPFLNITKFLLNYYQIPPDRPDQ
mgnify:CR=1 FL=1